nr:DsbA family oxidoreductase [Nocardioidaceae bacterium]
QTAAAAVRDEQAEAMQLGIGGVPFFVYDRTYGVSGAQPADAHLEVLRKVWSDDHPLTLVGAEASTSGGAACGPDGCAV